MLLCRMLLILISALLFVLVDFLPAQTIHVSIKGEEVEGKPVYWRDDFVALMGRDGRLVTFEPRTAESFRKVSSGFRSHSQATLRGELLREFGGGFDVSGTGQYLVVHPAGQRDQWADRFEELYRSMVHYLSVRGFRINRPEFPLVAVVFPSRQQYTHYARSKGAGVSGNSLGYYNPTSNRILMYDITAQPGSSSEWYMNAETIIHEAAHQTAFNVGIHSRLGYDPRWVVEGLGTMFEARGVWNSRLYPQQQDRVNATQLSLFRRLIQRVDTLELFQRQIASDRLFSQNGAVAYAHAWALTFYLTERQPRKYAEYVARVYRREPFQDVSQAERIGDFVAVFGKDFRMFDARLRRFIEDL